MRSKTFTLGLGSRGVYLGYDLDSHHEPRLVSPFWWISDEEEDRRKGSGIKVQVKSFAAHIGIYRPTSIDWYRNMEDTTIEEIQDWDNGHLQEENGSSDGGEEAVEERAGEISEYLKDVL